MSLIINVFFSIGVSLSGNHEKPNFTDWYFILFYITAELFLVMLFIKIPPINKRFRQLLEKIAISSSKSAHKTNILTVYDMYGKRAVAEVVLNIIPDFMKDKPLYQTGLSQNYSINILSIKRGKRVIDVTKDSMFRKGDSLVIYGLINEIKEAFIYSLENETAPVNEDKTNEINLMNNYGSHALVEVYIDEVPEELKGVKIKDSHTEALSQYLSKYQAAAQNTT